MISIYSSDNKKAISAFFGQNIFIFFESFWPKLNVKCKHFNKKKTKKNK